MKRFISGLLIVFLLANYSVSGIFAEEKSKFLKLPKWLNLYADVGYIYNKDYRIFMEKRQHLYPYGVDISDTIDITGKNLYNTTIGSDLLLHYKNIPVFIGFGISNIENVFINNSLDMTTKVIVADWTHYLNFDVSYSSFFYNIGSYYKSFDYIVTFVFSGSNNFNIGDAYKLNHNFITNTLETDNNIKGTKYSVYISKPFKKYIITSGINLIKVKTNIYFGNIEPYHYYPYYNLKENLYSINFTILRNIKYIDLYFQIAYNNYYKEYELERFHAYHSYTKMFLKTNPASLLNYKCGICYSYSDVLKWLNGIKGGIINQFNINEVFLMWH